MNVRDNRFRWAEGLHPIAIKAIVQRQRDEADRVERLRDAADEDETTPIAAADVGEPVAEGCDRK
jgi:hypothetical protein